MSRWLALARTGAEKSNSLAPNHPKPPKSHQLQPERDIMGVVGGCGDGNSENENARVARATLPDVDAFEERAAIIEFDAGLSRRDAGALATKAQGYGTVAEFRAAHEKNE